MLGLGTLSGRPVAAQSIFTPSQFISESVAFAESLKFTFSKAIAASFTTSDSCAKSVGKAFAESVATSESHSFSYGLNIAAGWHNAEAFSRIVSYHVGFSESWHNADAFGRTFALAFAESLQFFEEFRRRANGVISDMILMNDTLTLAEFTNACDSGHAPGYNDFRDFIQGNYDYTDALYRVIMESSTTDRAALTALSVSVDTPTILVGGEATITNASTGFAVTFPQPFHVAPTNISAVLKGGGSTSLTVEYSGVTTTGITFKLRDSSNTLQTGTLSYNIAGR